MNDCDILVNSSARLAFLETTSEKIDFCFRCSLTDQNTSSTYPCSKCSAMQISRHGSNFKIFYSLITCVRWIARCFWFQ